MKVTTSNIQYGNNVNFQKGLTSKMMASAGSMSDFRYHEISRKLLDKYNLSANFNGNYTAAWCVEKVANLFKKAGFELPSVFEYAPDSDNALGLYYRYSNRVVINSKNKEFENIRAQDKLEEKQKSSSPDTRHFLHTYLHEFSHAAHFSNLQLKFGKYEASKIFDQLEQFKPTDFLISPNVSLIKSQVPRFLHKVVDWLMPSENGLYSQVNLLEFFAESNARSIAQRLLLYDDIDSAQTDRVIENLRHYYIDKPYECNLLEGIKKAISHLSLHMGTNPIEELINKDIRETEGAIFNGNLEYLERKERDLLYISHKYN